MNFWHSVWSGEWLANVGLPLLLALLLGVAALGFAVHALRSQLRSDREIARSERAKARAELFAASLRDTASVLRGFAEEVRDPAFVPSRDGGQTRLMRMMDPLTVAVLRAEQTLDTGNAAADVSLFERSLRNRFRDWTIHYAPKARADGYSEDEIHLAWANLLEQYAQYFELTAANFEDWDGKELPVSAARQPQLGVPIPVEVGTVEIPPFPPAMLGETASEDEYFVFEGILRPLRQRRREPD